MRNPKWYLDTAKNSQRYPEVYTKLTNLILIFLFSNVSTFYKSSDKETSRLQGHSVSVSRDRLTVSPGTVGSAHPIPNQRVAGPQLGRAWNMSELLTGLADPVASTERNRLRAGTFGLIQHRVCFPADGRIALPARTSNIIGLEAPTSFYGTSSGAARPPLLVRVRDRRRAGAMSKS